MHTTLIASAHYYIRYDTDISIMNASGIISSITPNILFQKQKMPLD
jgi:hypothetical protein